MCGEQRVSQRKRASASLGPDPHAPFCWIAGLLLASPVEGGAVHTLCGPCLMPFSLLTRIQVTVSMLAEQEVWTVPM